MNQQQERRQQQQHEQEEQLKIEQQKISENRKKVSTAQRDKGKYRKKVQYVSIETSDENRKHSKDPEKFRTEFGMQLIADQFGDCCHNRLNFVGVQRIAALFGDAVM
mmetsp:Transcript_37145/g.40264  ORF Transcript_37145/g.40264 Transcript_37145/m.40264 type:complete len:107 (-) Transcript_37145:32-352(-)